MKDLVPFSPKANTQARTARQRRAGRQGPAKPHLKVGLLDSVGNVVQTLAFEGRDAWALDQLLKSGKRGCTPIDNPAPRWAHYVWKLRAAGLSIKTHEESHGGPYAGHHARYELLSDLAVLESSFPEADAA